MRLILRVVLPFSLVAISHVRADVILPSRFVGDDMLRESRPARIADQLGAPIARHLPVPDADDPDAMADAIRRNRDGGEPVRVGFARALASPLTLRTGDSERARAAGVISSVVGDRPHVSARVKSEGAFRLRLHLRNINLPEGSEVWVWGQEDEPVKVDLSQGHPGELWTPSVQGDVITIEVATPRGAEGAQLTVDAVMHNFLRPATPESTSCYVDASCYGTATLPVIEEYRRAVAVLLFVTATGSEGVCTGTLINPDTSVPQPYLLTANHCISTTASAASVDAFFDFRSTACGGTAPGFGTLPRVVGAALLNTSPATDFTLLRLSSLPGGRWLMGWSPQPANAASGAVLHRISHPADGEFIYTQAYARLNVSAATVGCTGLARPNFFFSLPLVGGAGPGSSGASIVTGEGYIVGQMLGACSRNGETCERDLVHADGAFSQTYPSIAPFLRPDTTPACSPCVASENTACALDNRFKVTLSWQNRFNSPALSGQGIVIRYAENRPLVNPTYGTLGETLYWAMYPFARSNVEVVMKIFKGVAINDQFWVFAAGLTNVEYTITITDTRTCRTWTRTNPHGQFGLVNDQQAFPLP